MGSLLYSARRLCNSLCGNFYICPTLTHLSFAVVKPSHTVASICTPTGIWFRQLSCYLCYSKVCAYASNAGNLWWCRNRNQVFWLKTKQNNTATKKKSRLLFWLSYSWAGSPTHSFVPLLMFSLTQFNLLSWQKIFVVVWIFCQFSALSKREGTLFCLMVLVELDC